MENPITDALTTYLETLGPWDIKKNIPLPEEGERLELQNDLLSFSLVKVKKSNLMSILKIYNMKGPHVISKSNYVFSVPGKGNVTPSDDVLIEHLEIEDPDDLLLELNKLLIEGL